MAINKRKILQSAQKHLQKGALDKALKDYQALLKADPKDANIRLKIGDIFLKQGNSEDAVGAYLKVATRFMDDGFDAKAVALFKQIVRIDPKRLEVYPSLAELYQRLGLNSDAMGALQTAADAHYREGDRDEALDLLRRMAALDPTNTANRMKVADLLRQEKRAEEAVEEFRAVAGELERQGDAEGRMVALERISELAPDDHAVLLDLGRARLDAGALLEAQEVGRRLIAADQEVAEHHELIAEALEKGEKHDEAGIHWRRVAELCRARGDESRARDLMQRYGDVDTLGPDESAEPILDQTDELAFGEVGGSELGLETDEFSDPGYVSQDGMQLGIPVAADDAGASPLDSLAASDAGAVDPAADFSLEPVDDSSGLSDEDFPADPSGAQPPLAADSDAAPTSAPAAAPAQGLEGDPEQLVAEASVLLRYGKQDRAIETLRSVVEADPAHRGALGKLAEALDAAGDSAAAGEVREQLEALDSAPEVAVEAKTAAPEPEIDIEQDVDLDLDVEAGAEDAAAASPEIDLDLEIDPAEEAGLDLSMDDGFDLGTDPGAAPELESAEPRTADAGDTIQLDLDADDDSGVDLDIDLGGEFESSEPAPVRNLDEDVDAGTDDGLVSIRVGAEDDVAAEDPELSEAATGSTGSDLGGLDLDASAEELDFDLDEELAAETSTPEAAPPASEPDISVEPAADAAEQADADAPMDLDLELDLSATPGDDANAKTITGAVPEGAEGSSSTTPRQMVDELEEAEFYYQQGMMAEAREVYERIISLSPNHPQALLRLGEIEASAPPAPSEASDLAGDRTRDVLADEASDALTDEASDALTDEASDALTDEASDAFADEASDTLADAASGGMADGADDVLDLALDDDDDDRPRAEDTKVADVHLADGPPADALFGDDLGVDFSAGELDDPLDTGLDAGLDADLGAEAAPAESPEVFDLEITADLGESEPSTPVEEPAVAADVEAQVAADVEAEVETGIATEDAEEERDSQGDSFDLAAELGGDFDEDPGTSASGMAPKSSTEEEGFEQVFAAFKQGVQKELGEGDHEAHYDLGIAYKEMGLFDDAILEFGNAMANPERKLACLHMMGLCALELGRVADATSHLEQALALPELPAEHQLGLRYDLGRAYAEAGDVDRARASFEAVLVHEPDFGDAAERLEALADIEVSEDEDPGEDAEAFESFDDLLGSDGAPEAATADAPQYESFDDLMGDDDADDADEEAEAPIAASEPEPDGVLEPEPMADPLGEPVGEPVDALDVDDEALEVVADHTAPPVEQAAEAEPGEADVLDADDIAELEPLDEPVAEADPGEEPDPGAGGKRRRRKKISFV